MKKHMTRNIILMLVLDVILGIVLALYIASTGTVPAADNAETYTDGTYTASAQGFGGPVAVTLELDASGAISSITIGDDYFNETEGYGKKALEDSFSSQFIGMKPPLTLSDIDAISGATVTSKIGRAHV